MDNPVIYQIRDNEASLKCLENELETGTDQKDAKFILRYPTVYIHNLKGSDHYEVYIGESNNIIQRTLQHYETAKQDDTWQHRFVQDDNARLFIIGHDHFNKSLTLDVENRLMHYMLGVQKVERIYNRRGNEQDKYFPEEEFNEIFRRIWKQLHHLNADLFPEQRIIEDTDIFKASPFHKLTDDQKRDKEMILEIIDTALQSQEVGQLIFVSGEAGTGKTVLNSNLFYELCNITKPDGSVYNCHLIVNHDQQLKVYQQIARKLGMKSVDKDIVTKPTTFINNHLGKPPVDVVFVDEAHLLWTQGKQSYRGKNQLEDLRHMAKVTVIMFDEHQTLHTQEYWDPAYVRKLKMEAMAQKKTKGISYYFELTKQLRIQGSQETVHWIRNFTDHLQLDPIPKDDKYDLRIFDSPDELERAIRAKASNEKTKLSRILATFDWNYIDQKKPADGTYWYVTIDDWKMPWNLQLPRKADSRKRQKLLKEMSWAEQPVSINEVGSTFTIQGFDLNYAGVILGPSVKYRDGKIVIDPSKSADKKATQYRTLSNGNRAQFGEAFIRNEINVLLTRGVQGLYLYAVDDELREALQKAAGHQRILH
ncbi:MAG: DNA/RNA helicase domain-containing protein [Lactimicrobium sp.]|jgi:DUF2075 family protein/DNA replication protein DnaC|uniref:DUF2075 domain-containing protein n=1 Tax=Lactimicrobium sp. TaxID=2563780 RepID=UPI002F354DD9